MTTVVLVSQDTHSGTHMRRVRGDVIEMYKHTHGKYTVVAEYIKMDTDSSGRHHVYKTDETMSHKKTIRQLYFSN